MDVLVGTFYLEKFLGSSLDKVTSIKLPWKYIHLIAFFPTKIPTWNTTQGPVLPLKEMLLSLIKDDYIICVIKKKKCLKVFSSHLVWQLIISSLCEWIARSSVNLAFGNTVTFLIDVIQLEFAISTFLFAYTLLLSYTYVYVYLFLTLVFVSLPVCPHLPFEFRNLFESTEQGFRQWKEQISLVREFLSLSISSLMVQAVQSSISSQLVLFLFQRTQTVLSCQKVISEPTLLVIQDSKVTVGADWQ